MNAIYENKKDDLHCRDTKYSDKALVCLPHLHYHIELALVHSGRSRLHVDTQIYDVEAGDIFIVFPNQVHSIETLKKEDYILFIVNPDIISELTKQFTSCVPTSNLIKGAARDKELCLIAERISELYLADTPYRNEMIRGYLLAFFGKLLGMTEVEDVQSKGADMLGTIINYCVENSCRPLTLGVLEKELHISKYYVSHIMNSKLHMGFNDYVNSIRVSNACKYLTRTDKSITEISDLVGFNTLRTFNRAFAKQLGMTPSQYRAGK